MNTDARSRYLADFERVSAALPGAGVPWLDQLRATALDIFAQRGFPTKRDEDWKYTSVAALESQVFRTHAFRAMSGGYLNTGAAALAGRYALGDDAAHVLVFHNGYYVPALSKISGLPAGATIVSLADTLHAAPQALEPYLANEEPKTAFGALNAAFMADGVYLHLKQGVMLESPVHLLFLSTGADAATHVRNMIVAEEGAQATVIEHYAGIEGEVYFTNAVTRIFAARDAKIDHYKLQQESLGAFHIAGIHAIQQSDSRLESHSFSLGGTLARNDIATVFVASGCEAALNGLYLAGGRQHVDHHTCIDHRRPNGTSREHYRGVLDGQAHAVFNGKVIVRPGAQKTNAYQANHNLLLSRDAEIDTKPELEIHADDVKCNHGATVGQLDEAQLFYLRSRSIDEAEARNLLVHAFAHDVIERIRVASLRDRLAHLLLARLPHAERIGELQ
ncbi:Fe-S cluster assembly protein SufD [Herbaspirillum sp. HC18]|nr:Fe-S cluster assembly protein SufD [Herbaspirillum sp. HC18]